MELQNIENPFDFILSGQAIFTCYNQNTNRKYTYKVNQCKSNQNIYFVSVYKPKNNNEYTEDKNYLYIGIIKREIDNKENQTETIKYFWTKKSKLPFNSIEVKGFNYIFTHLQNKTLPEDYIIYHNGYCGRCGRRLKTEKAIKDGYGSECIKYIEGIK